MKDLPDYMSPDDVPMEQAPCGCVYSLGDPTSRATISFCHSHIPKAPMADDWANGSTPARGQGNADYTTPEGAAFLALVTSNTVDWTEKGLKITRLRLLTDRNFPYYDVSYCHGELNGRPVQVRLPFGQLSKKRWKSEIVEYAKQDRVYAKALGILEHRNVSILAG